MLVAEELRETDCAHAGVVNKSRFNEEVKIIFRKQELFLAI